MIYALFTLGSVTAVVLLALLEQLGVPGSWIGYGFLVLALAFAALSGTLASAVDDGKTTAPRSGRLSGLYGGAAAAGNWISAGSFIGMAGVLFVLGYDGLAFVIGFAGGLVLAAVLLAPRLRRWGARSLTDFLAERYEGHLPRVLVLVVLAASGFVYLVAQLHATALIGQRLAGLDFTTAVWAGAGAVLLCAVLGGTRGVIAVQAALCTVLLAAYLVPALVLSSKFYGIPVPQLTYGLTLGDISGLELSMLKKRLADARTLKPHLQPFINLNWQNFLGLIFCLMLGTASMPHILAPHLAGKPARSRVTIAWALLLVCLLLATASAYAAFAKLEVYQLIDRGTSLSALPPWIYAYGKAGLIKICGADAIDPAAVAAACAKVSGTRGMLRHGDLFIDVDAITLATPEMAGLPYAIAGLVAAGGLAAALSMSAGLLATIAAAVPLPTAVWSSLVSRLLFIPVVAVAALAALLRPADIMTMVAWAFSLAAAGIFPALVLGLYWKRANSIGAALGILVGFGICAYYIVGTRFFAPDFFELWRGPSNASSAAVSRFYALEQAWLDAAPEARTAVARALNTHAQSVANWWGIKNSAAALFGLPAGFLTIWIVSLLTSARGRRSQSQAPATTEQ